jgi:transglutaminase-like putative cysteine protease
VTAAARAAPPTPAEILGDALGRIPRQPAEGWITLLAAALMVIALGASLVDAGWTPSDAGNSGFLLYIGGVGLGFGFIAAKLGWGRWRTHIVGALFAGLLLPLIAGGLVLEAHGTPVGWDPFGLAARMDMAWNVVRRVWTDPAVLRLPFTAESAHYHMIFGALVWGAGLLAGYTIFGHRRPLDAVVVLGLAMLANMALTKHDQLYLLVLFSAAALLLLIRTHVFEEEITWTRRKIGDPSAVSRLYINGGAAFVTAAVLGSILLTATASSAPLQGLWRDLPRHLSGLSQFLQAIAPGAGEIRFPGAPTFGSEVRTSGVWNPSNSIAFVAQLPPGEDATFKWRAGAYDNYFLYGWKRSTPAAATPAAAGAPLLLGTADAPTTAGRREITLTIRPDAFRDQSIVGPNAIASVDRETVAETLGLDGWFSTVVSSQDIEPYTVTALIPVSGDVPGGLTEAQLRSAGTAYPPELLEFYLQQPDGALGPEATKLLQTITARAQGEAPEGFDPDNAYDLARTMERYLASPQNFKYNPDVQEERKACGAAVSTTECFAIMKQGYCEYFAGSMAAMLRASGVPTRVAYGFLGNPNSRGDDNVESVGGWLAHWWVEVYFPGAGWVEFDPTGSIGQQVPLPSGSVGPATARPSLGSLPPRTAGPTNGGVPTPPRDGNDVAGIGPFIAIALVLLIGVAALAFAAYRRTPSRPMHPDQAWGSLAGLAARFGLGPRPSQTVYEYAGALGDEVPMARVELTTIARAKVEVAYGHRDLGADRLQRIAQAYHRLRLAIIGVVVRRGLRRIRGRGGR